MSINLKEFIEKVKEVVWLSPIQKLFASTDTHIYVFDFELEENSSALQTCDARNAGEVVKVLMYAKNKSTGAYIEDVQFRIKNADTDIPYQVCGNQNILANDFIEMQCIRSEQHPSPIEASHMTGWKYKKKDNIQVEVRSGAIGGSVTAKIQICLIVREKPRFVQRQE